MPRRPSVVDLANDYVSIHFACTVVGMHLPASFDEQRSVKVSCPFEELYHSDGGAASAMRIYPESNSAWCFSCSYYYTPVSLVARALDLSNVDAAELLLQRAGYRPPDPMDVWNDVVAQEVIPDKVLLGEALKTYCRRIDPAWSTRQYEQPYAGTLRLCLGLLDRVHSDADAREWLGGCKKVMSRILLSQNAICREAASPATSNSPG